MTIGHTAFLILHNTDHDETHEHYDEGIRLVVVDFVMVPIGTKITIYDGESCLFEDGTITEYYFNNRHGGLLVEVHITMRQWKNIYTVAQKVSGYVLFEYPKPLSLFHP